MKLLHIISSFWMHMMFERKGKPPYVRYYCKMWSSRVAGLFERFNGDLELDVKNQDNFTMNTMFQMELQFCYFHSEKNANFQVQICSELYFQIDFGRSNLNFWRVSSFQMHRWSIQSIILAHNFKTIVSTIQSFHFEPPNLNSGSVCRNCIIFGFKTGNIYLLRWRRNTFSSCIFTIFSLFWAINWSWKIEISTFCVQCIAKI